MSDDRFGLVEIRAFGTYAFKISDAGKFIKDIVGTDSNFTNFEINEHLKSLIATRFTNTVGQANLPIELYAANTTELSDTCREVMSPEFESVGISLEKFYIENVSMPEDLKKEIFEYSRIDKLDLDKLTKFKTAKAIEAAAQNEGGNCRCRNGHGYGICTGPTNGRHDGRKRTSRSTTGCTTHGRSRTATNANAHYVLLCLQRRAAWTRYL